MTYPIRITMKQLTHNRQLYTIQLHHHCTPTQSLLQTPKINKQIRPLSTENNRSQDGDKQEWDLWAHQQFEQTPQQQQQQASLFNQQEQPSPKQQTSQIKEIKQQQSSKNTSSRKIRTNWTQQKYEQLLNEFKKVYTGTQSKSIRQIAKQLGFCSRTIQHKWNQYVEQHQSIPSIRATLTSKKSVNKNIQNKTKIYIEAIKQILANNGLLNCKQIAQVINQKVDSARCEQFKNKVNADNVARILKKGGYRYERIPYLGRNMKINNLSQKTINQRRYEYSQLYLSFLQSDAELIFLDQTEISLYLKRQYCWMQKDLHNVIVPPLNRQSSIALLCTLTGNGGVGWKIFDGPLQKSAFSSTLKQIISEFAKRSKQQCQQSRKILVMQQSCIHKMQIISLNQAAGQALQIFYLPPQSHMYNPVQFFFRQLKQQLKCKIWNNKTELIKVTKQIIQDKSRLKVQSYFNRVQNYINQRIAKLSFQT